MVVNANEFDTSMDQTAQRFVLWAFQSLGMDVAPWEEGYRCDVRNGLTNGQRETLARDTHARDTHARDTHARDRRTQNAFDGAEPICFSFESAAPERESAVEHLTFGSPLFRWLMRQLSAIGEPVHSAPTNQPRSVHEISESLFACYDLDVGTVHLAGCTLEERPFLRLTFLEQETLTSLRQVLAHIFLDIRGNVIGDELRTFLNLDDLTPVKPPPQRLNSVDLQRWIAAANKLYQSCGRSAARSDLIAVAVVWCTHAEGKLSFLANDESGEVSFSSWAKLLRDGHAKPPPYTCPYSREKSYHLSTTDDGRLTVAEAIGICAETGKRVLKTELETCAATGSQALEDQFVFCPVSQQRILRTALATCDQCRQQVNPDIVESGQCSACRNLEATSKDDPRMARVLGEYPPLDQWRRWALSETGQVYILAAASLTKRLLLVVEKESLKVLRIARRSRFSAIWMDLESQDRHELLR